MKKNELFNYHIISMEEFLLNYANCDGIFTDEIIAKFKDSKMTHLGIDFLNQPFIKKVPFDIVTKEDILTGRILLVSDFKSKNRIASYIRPELLLEKERGMIL